MRAIFLRDEQFDASFACQSLGVVGNLPAPRNVCERAGRQPLTIWRYIDRLDRVASGIKQPDPAVAGSCELSPALHAGESPPPPDPSVQPYVYQGLLPAGVFEGHDAVRPSAGINSQPPPS